MNRWEALDKQYVWHPFTQQKGWTEAEQLVIDHGEGVKLVDRPGEQVYPMPMLSVNDDAVLAGRVREDPSQPNGLELFLSVDNLRKGGATNLVQAARLVAARHLPPA